MIDEGSDSPSHVSDDKGPEEAPDRLLEAAGPIFARDGFERATVREICGDAGTNVASVAYYFGDKMGLYRAVIRRIREARERQFPMPSSGGDPEARLYRLVQTLLSRMLACDESSWQTQIMMREMHAPTAVFRELVDDYFRPLFRQLMETLQALVRVKTPLYQIEQLAFSVVGQCLYYRVGSGVLAILIPEDRRALHYSQEWLSRHITAVTLSAIHDLSGSDGTSAFGVWCDPSVVDQGPCSLFASSSNDD